MTAFFQMISEWLLNGLIGMDKGTHLYESLHFFIYESMKIFFLLVTMIYIISWLRAALDIERVRSYLMNRHRFFGYVLAAVFGSITPFCSCSSIPLFLGFTQARIPIGITMSFLITSPMINEVAIVLLGGVLGKEFTIIYVLVGITAGVIGGFIFDLLKAERFLQPQFSELGSGCGCTPQSTVSSKKLTKSERHKFAKEEVKTIITKLWKWIIVGVGIGAAFHGFVPKEALSHFSEGQWWSVPAVVLMGIPLYADVAGVIPVIQSLITKGLPIGTAVALMMSISGASLPAFVMLKQVMRPRLLVIFFFLLLILFTISGWIFNALTLSEIIITK